MSRVQVPSIAPFFLSEAPLIFFQALVLGIVQGLTEFFPISSSAHLRIAKWLFDLPLGDSLLYFDLSCHSGTLIALCLYLRKEVFEILCDIQKIAFFSLALLPLVPAYFLLKPLRTLASSPSLLGYFLILTALLLFMASRAKIVEGTSPLKAKNMLYVGAMQAMALVPGISRSGSTMAAGRFLGWDWLFAAKFSFLLAIPTILGGQVLETWKALQGKEMVAGDVSMLCYITGFVASLITGLFSVRVAFLLYQKGKISPIAWYCFGLGLFAIWAFHGS